MNLYSGYNRYQIKKNEGWYRAFALLLPSFFVFLGGDMLIDTHYDLLTIAYLSYLKNDYRYLQKISNYFNSNNVSGVIANLYFMSRDEMRQELHPNYYQDNISVLQMFQISKKILESHLKNTDILYSIEGADYINDEFELEQLYNAGLNCLILTWNTKSKYGSGNRSDIGLTDEGKIILKKAIDLNLGIDLSHANEKTFDDMIEVIKKEKKYNDVCCYASHSNSRSICNRKRNLSDEQLFKIASVGGLVGVFSNRNFIMPPDSVYMSDQKLKNDTYLEHIKHVSSIVGLSNVMVATDDMDFCSNYDEEYKYTQIYDYSTVRKSIYNNLKREYNNEETYNIMYRNAKEKIFEKIRKNQKSKGGK